MGKGDRSRTTGDKGVSLADHIVVFDLDWAFERFDKRDRGIDACIVMGDDDGRLTGRLIAAQVKGGSSWFRQETDEGFVFYEDLEHFEYWMEYSIPVVILLSDLENKVVYWVEVTPSTVESTPEGRKIVIPRDQILNDAAKPKLAGIAASLPTEAGRAVENEIARIRERYSIGQRQAALESLRELARGALWRFAERSVRAEGYVDLAIWAVECAKDFGTAKIYANLAERDGARDLAVARAVIAHAEHGAKAALDALGRPSTGRAYDFSIRLRLETEGVDNAKRAMDARPPEMPTSTRASRVISAIQFGTGDREGAHATVRNALERSPSDWSARFANAVFQLATSIPSADAALCASDVPPVVVVATVNHDKESLARIREAARTFADLERSTDDVRLTTYARAWRLACLASDPEAQTDADSLISTMIESPDSVTAAVWWALARDVKFDTGEVLRRLSDVASSTATGVLPTVASFNVLLISGQITAAAKLLKQSRKSLRSVAPDLPLELEVHLLAAKHDLKRATKTAESVSDETTRRRLLRVVAAARDPETLASLHEEDYASGGGFEHLVAAAEYHRSRDDWTWILEHADMLLTGALNEYTVRLTSDAARRLGRFDRCADILEQWIRVVESPSSALRMTWVQALMQVDVHRAAVEADRLLHDESRADHAYIAIQAFVRALDLNRLTIAARALIHAPGADVTTLLNAAMLTLGDEPATSAALMRRAFELGISDNDVPMALMLANALHLDEAAALFDRLPGLATDTGPIQAVTRNHLALHAERYSQALNDVIRGYFGALTPIHVVAAMLGTTMAEWFYESSANENVGAPRLPLLTRFGAIPDRTIDFMNRRVHMDVSAVLLAAKLNLLEIVEESYQPIFVSVHIGSAIADQQRRLARLIPEEGAALEVRSLIADAKLQPIDTKTQPPNLLEIEEVLQNGPPRSVLIEGLPATEDRSDEQARVLDLRSFAGDLRQRGILRAAEMSKITDAVSTVGVGSGAPPNYVPVLSWAAASVLSDAGLLTMIAARTPLFITAAAAERSRTLASAVQRRRAAKAFVDTVAARIRDGYERGVFRNVPSSQATTAAVASIDGAALHDLINASLSGADLVWIDDRAASRLRLNAPVIGIVDVLSDLEQRGIIDEKAYLDALSRLRAMNVRYLPLEPREVTTPILTEPSVAVFDTAEMLTLSQYLASTALDPQLIRVSDPASNELQHVLTASRQVAMAIETIWRELTARDIDPTTFAAMIVERFYVSSLGATTLFDPDSPRERLVQTAALELTRLYQLAVPLALNERVDIIKTDSATQTYIRWVTRSFAMRRLRSDPDVAQATAVHMANILEEVRREVPPEVLSLFRAVVSLVFTSLPREVQQAAFHDNAEYWRGYVEETMVAMVGTVAFREADFWRSLESALLNAPPNTSEVTITVDSETAVVNDPLVLTVAGPQFRTLLDALLSDGDIFDTPRETRRLVFAELQGAQTARDRFVIVAKYRESSVARMYRELNERIRHAGALDETSLIWPLSSLADHVRLPPDERNEMQLDSWRTAAIELCEDVGIPEALRRLVTLPLPIADIAIRRMISDPLFETALRELAAAAKSPVPRMQIASICLRVSESHQTLLPLANELVSSLVSEEFASGTFANFESILAAISSWLSYDADASAYAPDVTYLLAWSHAARVHEIFSSEPAQKVQEFFAKAAVPSRDSIIRGSGSRHNALAPHYVEHGRIVFFGLAALMAEVSRDILEESGVANTIREALARRATADGLSSLLIDQSLFVGGRDSIFGEGSFAALSHLAGEKPEERPFNALRESAATLIDRGEREPGSHWIDALAFLLRQLPLHEDLRELFRASAAKLEMAIRAGTREHSLLAIATLADQFANWGKQDDHRRIEEILLLQLGRSSDVSELEFLACMNAVFSLASSHTSPMDAARDLARMVERVIEIAPAVGYRFAAQLSSIVWWLPVEQSGPLWRVVLRARERLGRVSESP